MKKEDLLIERLQVYESSDAYPFHMPGHKRREQFPNPFSIDITEIDGFDNLHHPEGILRESMEWAASVYGADHTYYLVNGSSCGILSAISGTVQRNGHILISRNCHKSVYHGVFLNHLKVDYVYPQIISKLGIQGGILSEDVETALKQNPRIQAVLIVSPTYDGIVSDIKSIAEVVHSFGIPLIVDEAHGAHFPFSEEFPQSALKLGADVVVQSVHKTLPSLTQTAVLHLKGSLVQREKIEQYLSIFQTSSPSYVLMASIERCIWEMIHEGTDQLGRLKKHLEMMRLGLGKLNHLHVMGKEWIGRQGVYDVDPSKIVVSTKGSNISGAELGELLREKYHLEMEMCGADHVVAITSWKDSEEGLNRLEKALLEIDSEIDPGFDSGLDAQSGVSEEHYQRSDTDSLIKPSVAMNIDEAMESQKISVSLSEAMGQVSGEFIYIYPPGIPIAAPGEVLTASVVNTVLEYERLGLPVQGLKDQTGQKVEIVTTGK